MAKFNQQSTGLHVGYRDAASGDVIFRINADGTINFQTCTFGDGTVQTTAAVGTGAGLFTFTSVAVSAAITLANTTNSFINATAGAGGITLTLPDATTVSGQSVTVKKVDTAVGTVTLATVSAQTIDDTLFSTSYLLTNFMQFVRLTSDGSNWFISGGN